MTQIAAGLAAIHKQKLVHRDIKPSNIMVSFEDAATVTVKIIDLGLAKTVDEPRSETANSMPGGFAGTPRDASPEQFAGVGVDIRSDLYSLGVLLWEMVTGRELFKGTPAEVMFQHQHAPLPLDRLEGVPQPVVALIEVLLEKDPRRRFQTPTELLKVISTTTLAVEEEHTVAYENLERPSAGDLYAVTRRSPARLGPEKISVARLPVTGSDIFGREEDIAFLDESWENQQINVATIVAWAGAWKNSSTIGLGPWPLSSIVRLSWFLAGPFTDKGAVGTLHPEMNFFTRLWLGLEIQIHGWERHGRRAKGWRISSPVVEPY